jgi:hypothetical protein
VDDVGLEKEGAVGLASRLSHSVEI